MRPRRARSRPREPKAASLGEEHCPQSAVGTRALTPNKLQSRGSLAKVIFPSFQTLRIMMAITAAPMP